MIQKSIFKSALILFFTLHFSLFINGQGTNWTLFPEGKQTEEKERPEVSTKKTNHIELVADKRITGLLNKEIRISEGKGTIPGFRVQIYYGSGAGSKTSAKEIQGEFLKSFPIVTSYLLFQSPNFKIRVGDFKTKLEAQKFLVECKSIFNNAFIVKDEIKITALD